MGIHINTKSAIAKRILLPGDPLRARYIAENYLTDAECHNEVRGMYGYTGLYKGERVSVQGTGMGMPSHAIYVHELINDHGAEALIRVGSCGSLQARVKIRDIVMALSSSTDSALVKKFFPDGDFAPTADWQLVHTAYSKALSMGIDLKVGSIMSSDAFYNPDTEAWKRWASLGALAVEMESAILYTLAARFSVKAMTLLTVSDSLVTEEKTSAEEREKTFTQMMKLALETVISI